MPAGWEKLERLGWLIRAAEEGVMDLTSANWNQMATWLGQLDQFRRVG